MRIIHIFQDKIHTNLSLHNYYLSPPGHLDLFIFIFMGGGNGYVHLCADVHRGQKRTLNPLEGRLQARVSCWVRGERAGNQALVPGKNSRHS